MPKPFSNNATPKYLGYVYQVLIAIEQCFQAKKNETIWIECYGDVYDGSTSTEVKYHFEKTVLLNIDSSNKIKKFIAIGKPMINCPKCQNSESRKDGIVREKQRYLCKSCGYRYTVAHKGYS